MSRCPNHDSRPGPCSILAGCALGPRWWVASLAVVAFPALVLCVSLIATVDRVQYLHDIPRYADEINEIVPAFDIARGRSFPLVSGPKHIGAGWDYTLAGGMLLFGRSPELPRTMMLVAGLATVALTFGYARSLGGRWAGLLAAGFLAVSAPHVLLSSRVAWSVCLTPLLGISAIWALDHAVSARKPWFLLVTGLLTGLALQAHPSFVALLPGLALFAVWRGRRFLRGPQAYLAAAVFLMACSNVLAYNLGSGFGGVKSVDEQYPGMKLGSLTYAETALEPARGLLLTLASAIDPTREPSVVAPFVLFVGVLSLAGLVHLARRRTALPALVVVSTLALLPLVHDDFSPLLKARYIMPLVPVVCVAVAVLVARIVARSPGWPRALALGAATVMLVGSQTSLMQFESAALAHDCTNAPQRALVSQLGLHLRSGEWILLDEGVLPSAERMGYLTLLELSSKKVGEANFGRGKIWDELKERPSFLTAVSDGKAIMIFEKQRLPLLPQSVAAIHPALRTPGPDGRVPAQGIGLYRVSPEGAALLAHDPEPGCGDTRLN